MLRSRAIGAYSVYRTSRITVSILALRYHPGNSIPVTFVLEQCRLMQIHCNLTGKYERGKCNIQESAFFPTSSNGDLAKGTDVNLHN